MHHNDLTVLKKPSVKADLTIYSQMLGVPGYCISVTFTVGFVFIFYHIIFLIGFPKYSHK